MVLTDKCISRTGKPKPQLILQNWSEWKTAVFFAKQNRNWTKVIFCQPHTHTVMDGVCLCDFCVMQAYLEMAQELVIDENILLQTLGMLYCTVLPLCTSLVKFECDIVTHVWTWSIWTKWHNCGKQKAVVCPSVCPWRPFVQIPWSHRLEYNTALSAQCVKETTWCRHKTWYISKFTVASHSSPCNSTSFLLRFVIGGVLVYNRLRCDIIYRYRYLVDENGLIWVSLLPSSSCHSTVCCKLAMMDMLKVGIYWLT